MAPFLQRLLVSLGVAWLVVAGLSFAAGRRAECELRAAVAALEEEGSVSARVVRYERGVFGSRAVVALASPGPVATDARAARLVLHQRIDHGPYPWDWLRDEAFDGRPILVRVHARPVVELEDEETIEEIRLPIAIEGVFTRADGVILRLGPGSDRDEAEASGVSADWEGLRGELRLGQDGASVAGELRVPRLDVEREDGAVRLRDLASDFDYRRATSAAALYVGESRLRIGQLAVATAAGGFSLHALELEDASRARDGVFSLEAGASLGALRDDGGRSLASGELALEISGLPVEPLAELASAGAVAREEGADPAAAKAELALAVSALWPRLFAAGPELALSRLRIETPDGEIRMAFRLGVDASDPAALVRPLATLGAVEVDAELSLPEPVLHAWLARPRPVAGPDPEPSLGEPPAWAAPAELAARRVETWLQRGYLERDDGHYLVAVRVRKGAVRLNGRVVATGAL